MCLLHRWYDFDNTDIDDAFGDEYDDDYDDDVLFHSICSEIYESRIITLTAFQFGVIFVCALWFLLFSVSTIFSQNAYWEQL